MAATMEDIVRSSFRDLIEEEKTYIGMIESEEEYENFMVSLRALGYQYSATHSRYRDSSKKEVRLLFTWKVNGISIKKDHPFRIVSDKEMACSLGGAYKKFRGKKESKSGKKRFHIQPSKKRGCSAMMSIKHLEFFPEYAVDNYDDEKLTWHDKKSVTIKLREDMEKGINLKSQQNYFICVSKENVHNHSVKEPGQQSLQAIHPKLVQEINTLCKAGVNNVKDLRVHLDLYVKKNFDQGVVKIDRFNTAFYPTNKVIYAHLYKAISMQKKSSVDQEALALEVDEWKQNSTDDIFFRPLIEKQDPPTQKLLFCHQTEWQKELLKKYGNGICLLDAIYKTTKYSVPLYFVVVRTNVCYQVVGTFVCQSETAECVSEALNVFKGWNMDWRPRFWMINYSQAEISAVEAVFVGSKAYLCRFYVEQEWQRWLTNKDNVGDKGHDILVLFRKIGRAKTNLDLEKAINDLNSNAACQEYPKALHYFTTTWWSVKERWIALYDDKDYTTNVTTKIGVENKNKELKRSVLNRSSNRNLLPMLKEVLFNYLPQLHRCYLQKNIMMNSECRQYDTSIPRYLHNRPHNFVKHVMSRLNSAETEFTLTNITSIDFGIFHVKSPKAVSEFNVVDFGIPSCTCQDFKKLMYPCKHFAAIFLLVPNWDFHQLPEAYKSNALINIDSSSIQYAAELEAQQKLQQQQAQQQLLNPITPVLPPAEYEIEIQTEEGCIPQTNAALETSNIQDSISNSSPVAVQEVVAVKSHVAPATTTISVPVKLEQQKCRNILKHMIELTYDCNDLSALRCAVESLKNFETVLDKSTVRDSKGLPVYELTVRRIDRRPAERSSGRKRKSKVASYATSSRESSPEITPRKKQKTPRKPPTPRPPPPPKKTRKPRNSPKKNGARKSPRKTPVARKPGRKRGRNNAAEEATDIEEENILNLNENNEGIENGVENDVEKEVETEIEAAEEETINFEQEVITSQFETVPVQNPDSILPEMNEIGHVTEMSELAAIQEQNIVVYMNHT